ncbi:MAG TPA: NAD(P)-binding domain-containing protein [candidate division Zixibacteria bacterium]|nr:NAD(P)-binding domain-containing protein [candidate division Zixibacteria bacterium]
MTQKIGIIGSGDVGKALANGFIRFGHNVMIGTNDSAKQAGLLKATDNKAKVGSFEDTARFGDLIVLSVKGTAAEAAARSAGLDNLSGKTVIDTTNPIADDPPEKGVLKYFTSPNQSLMENLQKLAPKAHFVKAFSCVGSALMVSPNLEGTKPTMFICGNSDEAKREVSKILDQFGWEYADMGTVEAARAIEPLAILWCLPGFLNNEWMHAFKLLKS